MKENLCVVGNCHRTNWVLLLKIQTTSVCYQSVKIDELNKPNATKHTQMSVQMCCYTNL